MPGMKLIQHDCRSLKVAILRSYEILTYINSLINNQYNFGNDIVWKSDHYS